MSSSAAKKSPNPELAVILLAAGNSSRLGTAKQLLAFKGTTLIRERATTIRKAFPELEQLIVVTGAKREAVRAALDGLKFNEAFNADFLDGMSTSVKTGLSAISPQTSAVMFLLVDQPFITQSHLRAMANLWVHHPDKVVAAVYGGITGVPAIFPRPFYSLLSALTGDQGARKVLARLDYNDIITFELPEAATDVDSAADLKYLSGI